MARPSCRNHRVDQLPPSAGAVEHDRVEFVLREPGQLSHMLHRGGDVGKLRRLACINGNVLDAGDPGAKRAERIQRRGCFCRQVQLVRASKQPFDDAIQFLPTDSTLNALGGLTVNQLSPI